MIFIERVVRTMPELMAVIEALATDKKHLEEYMKHQCTNARDQELTNGISINGT